MASRDRDKFRKYDSGAQKAKKRKLREKIAEKYKGSLDKFVSQEVAQEKQTEEIVNDQKTKKQLRYEKLCDFDCVKVLESSCLNDAVSLSDDVETNFVNNEIISIHNKDI